MEIRVALIIKGCLLERGAYKDICDYGDHRKFIIILILPFLCLGFHVLWTSKQQPLIEVTEANQTRTMYVDNCKMFLYLLDPFSKIFFPLNLNVYKRNFVFEFLYVFSVYMQAIHVPILILLSLLVKLVKLVNFSFLRCSL